MSKTVSIDGMAEAINEGLQEYAKLASGWSMTCSQSGRTMSIRIRSWHRRQTLTGSDQTFVLILIAK